MAHKGGVQIAAGVAQAYPQPPGQFPCGQNSDSYGLQAGWVHMICGGFVTTTGARAKSSLSQGLTKKFTFSVCVTYPWACTSNCTRSVSWKKLSGKTYVPSCAVTTLVLQSVVEVYDECWQVTSAPAMGAPVVESVTLPWIEPLPKSPTMTTVMAGGGVVGSAVTGVTDGVSLVATCWTEVLVMMGEEVDEGIGETCDCIPGRLQSAIMVVESISTNNKTRSLAFSFMMFSCSRSNNIICLNKVNSLAFFALEVFFFHYTYSIIALKCVRLENCLIIKLFFCVEFYFV
jgi:hypothetical protein